MATSNVKQHFIPQCYLRHFMSPESAIYIYNKRASKSYKDSISNIMCKDEFYSISEDLIENSDGRLHRLVIEKDYFANTIEPLYARTLDSIEQLYENWKVNEREILSDNLKEQLAYHIAIQFLRLPDVKNYDTNSLNDFLLGVIPIVQEGLAYEKKDDRIRNLKIAATFNEVINHFRSSYGNEEVIACFSNRLVNNYWTLHIDTLGRFYSSDFPIVVKPHILNGRPECMGLVQEGAEFSFPLSSHVLLKIWDNRYFANKSADDCHIYGADEKFIRQENILRYLYAKTILVSQIDDYKLVDFIRTLNGGYEHTLTFSAN